MQIDQIHWHDSLILEVRLLPECDIVKMRLLYPEHWESNTFVERFVTFTDAYGYKEFEGPIEGNPTILGASIVGSNGEWHLVRLETNAGYREVYCKEVCLNP